MSQSAGGPVPAVRWDHVYGVLAKGTSLHLYASEEAFLAGPAGAVAAHVRIAELKVLQQTDEVRAPIARRGAAAH